MNIYSQIFDRKLRCDDIPGAQPKIRHFEKKIVRNYPNQMMANISHDDEQNVRQYMNEKLIQDEQKYHTYRNVVDHNQKIDQAYQNSQIFDNASSRKNLKAMRQTISKSLAQNQKQLISIVDQIDQKEPHENGSEQINKHKIQQNNINDPSTYNPKDNMNEITDLSHSKIINSPPQNNHKYIVQEKDFYQLDKNRNFSGQKYVQSKQDLPLPSYRINSRLINNRNGNDIPIYQYRVDGNGSQLLREAYGEAIYQKNIPRPRISQRGERNGQVNRSYQFDNGNQKNKFVQNNKFDIQDSQNQFSEDVFIQKQLNHQQIPQPQTFDIQQELVQRQYDQQQRKRILSYNIINNNSFNYVYNKIPQQNQKLPQINPQIQNNHSYSVDRINQNPKQQHNQSNDNVQFRVNNIPQEYQQFEENTFNPESFTERRIQFNRKKQLIY